MNKIISKRQLSENVYRMDLEAPLIARSRKAGQFVIVMVDEAFGERIPLTIADADAAAGTITIIFQTVGATTIKLARLNEGELIPAVLGPLGKPTVIPGQRSEVEGQRSEVEGQRSEVEGQRSEVEGQRSEGGGQRAEIRGQKPHRVVCVGGGIGVAPLHPIAQAMKAAGNEVTIIMGARTKELFVMEDEMRAIAGERLILMTDDGSAGRKGLVTEPLKELCEAHAVDEVIAIGPPVMMKFCALATKPYGVKTVVSLNTVMIDGTGMCGGCRVSVGGETKFVCVDGPEFDGHLVDWDQMMKRMSAFKPQEVWAKEHACNMLKA